MALPAFADLFYIENPYLGADHTGGTRLGGNATEWLQNGQTFSITQPAYLVSAEFFIYDEALPDSPDTITATLRTAVDLFASRIASVTGFILTEGTEYCLFDFGHIALESGDYAITVAANRDPYVVMSMPYNLTNWPDASGTRLASGSDNGPFEERSGDLRYKFTFEIVPEPTTITLLIVGAMGCTILNKSRGRNLAEQSPSPYSSPGAGSESGEA